MKPISSLIQLADQFLSDRNWWQFHNPKNDSMNILVEAGELAEHFSYADYRQDAARMAEIADELSDVWFATVIYTVSSDIDFAHEIGLATQHDLVTSHNTTYEQLQDIILTHQSVFGLQHLQQPSETVFSLIHQASRVADLFVWSAGPDSIARSKEQERLIHTLLAKIIAHQIVLAHQLDINLPEAYTSKMERNRAKYPVDMASGEKYQQLKDSRRSN